MAQVTWEDNMRAWMRGRDVPGAIDSYITYLFREFRGISEAAAEWDEWEEHERLDFVIEWPIKEDRLRMLSLWAADGEMTPDQCARYEELLRLVAQHRPTLDRLLAD
jgi:hypothetical protein